MAKTKNSTKPKSDATALRNALPFYSSKRRPGRIGANWWNVTPTGNYSTDLETGKEYARAFIPLLRFNVGPAALGWVISSMKLANKEPDRGIDAVATGFILEIGGSLQAAIVGMAVAAIAIEKPASDLGPKMAYRRRHRPEMLRAA